MCIDVLSIAISSAIQFGRILVIHQLPSTAFEAAERGTRAMVGQTLHPESAPVVGSDLIQRVHNVVEGVSLDQGGSARGSITQFAEIVQRFRAFRLLTDE